MPVILLFLLLVIDVRVLRSAGKQGQEDLEALVSQAMTSNPEVKASAERWRMTVERARQAGALEDPMMMLRVQNALVRDPLAFDRDTMTGKVIGVSQKLPFFGKRDLMREEAGFEAEAERWVVEERRIELRRMVKEAWYQIYQIDRSLETVSGTIRLLDDLIRLAESMYAVGKTGQKEIFQAQLERSKMEEVRIGLEQKRRSLVAALNALVYRTPDTIIPPIPKMRLTPLSLSGPQLESLAFANRPALKSLNALVDKTNSSTKLAEKEFYPDFTVSLEYMQKDPAMGTPGYDMYSAGLTFNLPIQSDRIHAKIAETEASRRMASQERAALQNRIRLGISDGLAQLERSRKLIQLYDKGILAQATGAMESAMASYRTDKAKFSEVLASRTAVFNSERDYHGAMADYQIQVAVLEGIVGTTLPPAP